MKKIRFCLSQINATVGDIPGNTQAVISGARAAFSRGCDIVVFPELAVTGYPPEDLLLKKGFIKKNMAAISKIASEIPDITAVAGFVNSRGGKKFNSAAVINNKKVKAVYNKINLPNYGVFDEKRYFEPGTAPLIFSAAGTPVAVTVCEDLWSECAPLEAVRGKTDYIINISASPYHAEKWKERVLLLKKKAAHYGATILYCNLVGGQDELIFDGHSLVINKKGEILSQGWQFAEYSLVIDLPAGKPRRTPCSLPVIFSSLKNSPKKINISSYKPVSRVEEIYEALKLGTRDYIIKNGFKKALVALSGGVDSTLVSVIAADAIGPENVSLVYMPSKYSSKESYNDAFKLSKNLGIKLQSVPIQEIFGLYLEKLSGFFKGLPQNTAEENLQSRIRGNIIMALSNKFNWLVLTTGNKSEMSTGYATLYGDMAGGFAVLKDVPKTLVYSLCKMRNKKAGYSLIPANILKKAPTAELRHNQKDRDTLPPYGLLDAIIEDYVEKDRVFAELKNKYNPALLDRVIKM
ncbi:MAG TPA: NAD+ synthase, partial [bacterium]|nr:NAD+ synthase [bacterium]